MYLEVLQMTRFYMSKVFLLKVYNHHHLIRCSGMKPNNEDQVQGVLCHTQILASLNHTLCSRKGNQMDFSQQHVFSQNIVIMEI